MTYQQFNRLILRYYFEQSEFPYCHLGISLDDFQKIISLDELLHFNEIKRPWSHLLNRQATEPQYFGLLAIQCLATSLMERDNRYTSQAYQVRFIKLTGISSEQKLQAYFRENVNGIAVQEQLWEAAQKFLYVQKGKYLTIPPKSIFRGRFVQYPLSQALLRKEDLKCFHPLFSLHFRVGENICLQDFTVRVLGSLDKIELSHRARRVLTDKLTKAAAIRQVFNYFHIWDGLEETIRTDRQSVTTEETDQTLILRIIERMPEFFLYPNVRSITLADIWTINGFSNQHQLLKIFNAHEYYPNEFEEGRLLIPSTSAWLLFDTTKWTDLHHYFTERQKTPIDLGNNTALFYLDKEDHDAAIVLKKYFASQKPITLIGGLKTGSGRVYFEGFGPQIQSYQPYSVLYNGQKCIYEPCSVIAGVFSVRTDNFRDTIFTVIPISPLQEPITSRERGWDFKSMSVTEEVTMEGALLHAMRPEQPLETWRRLHAGERPARKVRYRNLLLQVLANYYEQSY